MSNVKRGAVRTPVRDSGGTLSHCGICAAGFPAALTKIENFPDWGGAFARMTQVPLRPWPGWLNLYRAWHLPNSPPCCHPRRHPAAAAGARPPAVGAGAQPYTAGRPTPPQRLKNPMGPGGTGRPRSTWRLKKLVRGGFCENGLAGGCRGDFPKHIFSQVASVKPTCA